MGRASRGKTQAAARKRDRPQLLEHLHEQIAYLDASAASFDSGAEAEAKRIAVSLRVLLHDTDTSHSLLHLLGVKERMKFVDTAEHVSPRNLLLATGGLVMMQALVGGGVPGNASYIPPLDNGPLSPLRIRPPSEFSPWWNNDIARVSSGALWSRKQFVLVMANKEGGAHVDPNVHGEYESLAKKNGLGYISGVSGDMKPLDGNVVAASVRQIAYEVQKTFEAYPSLIE